MAMHHAHAHAHEARSLEKRGSHFIKASIPELDNKYRFIHIAGKVDSNKDTFIHKAGLDEDVVTVVSHVYVTASKTFAGPAVYVTETETPTTASAATTTPTEADAASAAATTSAATQNSYESAKSKQHSTQNSYESAKSRAHESHNRVKPTSTTARIVGHPLSTTSHATAVKGTPLSVTGTSDNGVLSSQQHGMTSGGKAGLAIGILAILGLVAGLALFCIRRRKKQIEEKGEKLDEKHASQNSFFSGTAAAFGASAGEKRQSMKSTHSSTSRTGATAPRLSLRAVPSMFPNMSGTQTPAAAPAMSEKRGQNPFSDPSATRSASPPSDPFADGDGRGPITPGHSAKPSWEGSQSATPQVGTAAAVAVGAAGAAGAGARGPNNVHRVQLDFKPSMDDELELKSGQLVRMLHEYDDGWALCIRMDRTQQGVCPRTCLSKLPVKPRPPPQNSAQGRPMGPPPPGMRGPPPPGGNRMMPRPLTPTGRERANTAGGRTPSPASDDATRARSQSVSAASERPISPVEAGVPARKPVPGQAM